MRRRLIASIVLGGVMAILAGPALAADAKKPDATLKLTEGSMAMGIGWSWGKGELSYMGKTYKFKVEGASVGEVGKTEAKATGQVYNLKNLGDFNGVFAAGGAGATGGTGASASALVNDKGVQIVLTSTTKGANIKVAVEGLKVTLEK
jgi:hypothetical protein